MSRPHSNDGRSADEESPGAASLPLSTASEPAKRSSLPQRAAAFVGWSTTIALATLAVLHFAWHDGTHLLTMFNAFTRYLYLPAYAVLGFALWTRRRRLAIANAAIIACHLYWLAPDFLRDRRFDVPATTSAAAANSPSIRIFFANVRAINWERGPLLREIRDAKPDVVILVEFSQIWWNAFHHSPLIATYPFGSGMDHARIDAINVFSKLPLKSDTNEWFAGRCIETVEIEVGSQTLRIAGLHAPRPMEYLDNDYVGYWKQALPMLLRMERPLVAIGDFNATQYSSVYQALKAGGLRSAHEDRGRGYAVSWPNGDLWIPPIRIDQAFVSANVECVAIQEGEGSGSDHKPLILDVRLRQ
jgi:endonuclease/exonuclease/phosphatase (EEP) superfamily protein YafD